MFARMNRNGQRFVLCVHHDGQDTSKTLIHLTGTQKSIIVDMPLEDVNQAWYNWQVRGAFIQDAFRNWTADQREFILTGISKEEWDATFKEEEN